MKNGRTKKGTIRYRCKQCGSSKVNTRPNAKLNTTLKLFNEYLVHSISRNYLGEKTGLSRSSLWRRFSKLLELEVPPVLPENVPRVILLDGFYLAYPSIKRNRHKPRAKTDSCILLWALDSTTSKPLYWKFYRQLENPRIWQDFIYDLTIRGIVPDYIVHDGHNGITSAVNRYWVTTKHQRCLVHLMSNMHKDLGISPRTNVARELKQVVAGLFSITDEVTWQLWQQQWQMYCERHEKTLESLRIHQLCFDEYGGRIPKAVLEAFTVINNAYRRDELTAFLDEPQTIPRTTNAIESLNGNLRELLRRHRGLSLDKRISLVSWYLVLKQKLTNKQLREHLYTLFDT